MKIVLSTTSTWVLVHEINLQRANSKTTVGFAVHPNNGEAVFLFYFLFYFYGEIMFLNIRSEKTGMKRSLSLKYLQIQMNDLVPFLLCILLGQHRFLHILHLLRKKFGLLSFVYFYKWAMSYLIRFLFVSC